MSSLRDAASSRRGLHQTRDRPSRRSRVDDMSLNDYDLGSGDLSSPPATMYPEMVAAADCFLE